MRTWLLITLQRYGGWKEYLGYEKVWQFYPL